MYKFIKRNQKKFLAVFGVLLMIAFLASDTSFNRQFSPEKQVVGKFGEEELRAGDVMNAREEIRTLQFYGMQPLARLQIRAQTTGVMGLVRSIAQMERFGRPFNVRGEMYDL